ncbi:MAG: class I SAM-dependent methyltransferase [candidate division Zixibacteria bacterium]|nr:class I SAM-dependent methyltransferase [candidate division Zixibacteria bacterium]MCI0531537.1 class I SAM-dependent methyltransferase [candidate division Zixibacteria bacterium]
MPELTPEMQELKSKLKATWMAGDFGQVAKSIEDGAVEFINRLQISKGARVLDVACGTGNLAIPAAKAGALVTGLDFASNLVEQARVRAKTEGLNIQFQEGDAEAMPYPDGSFDVVVTMFGAMFCPRPEKAASELIRVTKPGGRMAMANWTPAGFAGQMFKLSGMYAPPPPGMPAPVLWGDETVVNERLRDGTRDLKLTKQIMIIKYLFGPADVVEHFIRYFGPTKKAYESLDANGQKAYRDDMVKLWTQYNRATDGTTRVEGEYLEVIAARG